MENSVFIAKLFAVLYLTIGVGMLVDPKFYRSVFRDYQERASLVYLGGILALISGFLLVFFHNLWQPGWQIAITILGWLALAKGLILLIYPQWIVKQNIGRIKYALAVVVALLMGCYFGYFGYFFSS